MHLNPNPNQTIREYLCTKEECSLHRAQIISICCQKKAFLGAAK